MESKPTFVSASFRTHIAEIDIDWNLIFSTEEVSNAAIERDIEWTKSDNVRLFQRAGRATTGEEVIFSPRSEDIDITGIQHRRISDIEE